MEVNNFDLMSFDLGEAGGGPQMIFAHKPINETEHYVFTLGNPPKDQQNEPANQTTTENANHGAKESFAKQMLSNLRNRLGNLKGDNQKGTEQTEQSNMKLRCFKLSQVEGKKYLIEEYTTPQAVSKVACFFGADKNDPTITQ